MDKVTLKKAQRYLSADEFKEFESYYSPSNCIIDDTPESDARLERGAYLREKLKLEENAHKKLKTEERNELIELRNQLAAIKMAGIINGFAAKNEAYVREQEFLDKHGLDATLQSIFDSQSRCEDIVRLMYEAFNTQTGLADSYFVYMHMSPEGKVYIGQSKNTPTVRWGGNGQQYRKNEEFYSDIKRFGWDSFRHFIIATNLNKRNASAIESALIRIISSVSKQSVYNVSLEVSLDNLEYREKDSLFKRNRAINKYRASI